MFASIDAPGHARRLHRLLGIGMLALAVLATACGDDDPTGPEPAPAEIDGSYALTQVRTLGNLHGGGSGLPVTFTDGAGKPLTFETGTLTLTPDGDYALEVEATFGSSSVVMTDEGSYARSGSGVSFSSSSGNPRLSSAALSGTKMTAQSSFGGIPFEIDLRKE